MILCHIDISDIKFEIYSLNQWLALRESWQQLEKCGVLEENLINHVWHDCPDQKAALLGLMEKFDLIALRLPPKSVSAEYILYCC